jgi:SPX domain protein involved in polyphosphate accumulation
MKFGEKLLKERLPEWAPHYPDYDGLKTMLLEMERTGQNRAIRGRQDLVPHSIGGTEERIVAAGPSESEFMRKLDSEIEKVSKHCITQGESLRQRSRELEARYEAAAAAGMSASDVIEITNDVERCELGLLNLDDFVNLSYSAFIKIVKKHDKHSSCPLLLAYCVKLQGSPFLAQKLTSVIMSLSNINAKLMGKETKTEAQFDPNQAGGTSFVRKTTKYWVKMTDLTRVKCIILKQLPVYKFTVGEADSDRITSIYFDNDNLDLYTGRLHKTPGAIAVRMRWYGDDPKPGDAVYVERKVHNESWYGEESRKERFSLPDELIQPYLEGKITAQGVREILEKDKSFKGSIDAAVKLAAEVQSQVLTKKLKPYLRTQYMRTAFQKKGDATVRASLDTELCMALEPVQKGEYRYKGELLREQICLVSARACDRLCRSGRLSLAAGLGGWSGCWADGALAASPAPPSACLSARARPSGLARPVRLTPHCASLSPALCPGLALCRAARLAVPSRRARGEAAARGQPADSGVGGRPARLGPAHRV